jgi:hypothetical protein
MNWTQIEGNSKTSESRCTGKTGDPPGKPRVPDLSDLESGPISSGSLVSELFSKKSR